MRKAATLVELIFTIIISSILTIGTATLLKNMAYMIQKAQDTTELSLDTQSALDQLSTFLYARVPNSVIGYDGTNNWANINELSFKATVLEWLTQPIIAENREGHVYSLHSRELEYYPFIDLEGSNPASRTLKAPFMSANYINLKNHINRKYKTDISNKLAIVFAGSFDYGVSSNFGWHNSMRTDIYKINILNSGFQFQSTYSQPEFIYEKFYLVESAVAVTLGQNIDKSASCITDLKLSNKELDKALLLFTDYRPWLSESYCADKGSKGTKKGFATVLSTNIDSFEAREIEYTIRLSFEAKKKLKGSSEHVKVSKQKVVL